MDSSSLPDLDSYRAYLTVLARGQIPVSMQSRLDASDIVQETLLEAHQKRDQFLGSGESRQLAGWLRKLLSCNLLDALKTQRREQRDVRREQMIADQLEESALGLENLLMADDTSPGDRFDKQTRALIVAKAVEELPESQRDVILMRYFGKASLEEIAGHLRKSKSAAAGLLKRGLAALRERLREEQL